MYPSQPYFDEINFKVDNCNLKGIKIYNCSNVKGTYTITNSTLDGTGAPADAYAIHLQGNETEPLTINISGNTISGYDRGINIDQNTANATISGNKISIKEVGRSCIQLSRLANVAIADNTLELTGGNAITLHELLLGMPTVPEITVKGNTITGNGYLIYDDAVANNKAFTSEKLTLTIGTNTVASTVDTKQGVKGSNKYGISETVATVVKEALTTAYVATVNGVGYATLADAIAAATPDANGVITYEISGKATVDSTGWIQVARAGLAGLTKVEFVGKTSDAEICITGGLAILADQNYDIDVSFEALTLSKPNPTYGGDYGHSTNYFTTWLRNTNAAENTVTYTNCTFPNGACNNQYGKTVFDGCKFTNATSGKYNFWNYGGNTEIKNSTFTGVRGIKTYNEGTLAVAPTVKIENTTFDGLTEKAAIVTSKATDITLDNVSATKCTEGFFQKDIEYSGEKTTIEANGSAISGNFNITAEKGAAAAKEEFNISAGTFTSEVSSDYLADGFELKKNIDGTYGVKAGKYVAQIGDVKYETLADALAAANAGDTVTLLADINTPEKTYEITKSLTIDLNGKTVTGSGYDGVFEVTGENIKVVLDATNGGKVIAVENSGSAGKYAMAVWMCGAGSTLTINGGEFIQNITSTNDKQMDMIYASAGTIIINSGSFTSGTPKWTLNINDSAYKNGTANIIVTGGTFTGYDPRNAENEGKGTSLVADGVGIDKNADGTFTAKSGMAAQIVDENGGSVKAYATLAEAIAAAKSGATVTLLSNTRENVTISKELTLDLNGHTLSGGTTAGKAALTNYGKLTINDSSEAQTGTIKREDNNTGGYYVIDNKGKMTINGGNVINDSGKKGSSLIRNGGAEDDNAYPTLNIIGGTFTQLNFIAIKNDALSILNVSGGKITSNASAIQNWYKATITGGEINGQLWTDAFAWDGGKSTGNTTISGNAKFNGEIVMDITSKNVVPELNISGGDLNVTNWRITTEAANAGAKPAVSGGTFKHAIPEEYCADGFIPTQNDDGTYGVKEGKYVAQIGDVKYETLEEAFAAAKNGDTITLLEDCKSDRINLEDKSVTVVLNGKTLTSTAAYGVMFCAKNGNKITIDGTVEGSKLVGTLMITAKTDGHIEVNGGTYESNQYCPIYVNGAVNSENSTVTVKNAIIKATNISSDQDMGCGVYLAGYSTSVFENCTITAPITGIEIRAGKLTLNNCDVTGGNGEVTADANGNGTTVTNAALAISQHTTKKPIEVTINGGTFNGTAAVYQTDVQGTGSADVKIAVKSGTFNGTISGETDGTIAISGGKFKVKVDDKYFDGNHACSTDTTDGYYTVAGHPITKVGLTLGEDISIRIVVDAKYKDGKIKVTYETYDPNTKGMVTKELIINKCEYAGLDEEGNKKYQFRISNVTPQMADVVFTLQYLDSEGNKIGSAKQISIVEYCRKFAETNKFEAYKAKIGQLLNYCATAMDFRAVSHKDDMYNGLSWAKRATALRAKISEFGYTVADIDFGKVGQYSNAAIENIVTGFGIEFAESIKLYYFTAPDNYKDGYTYVADGLLTPVPVYEDGVLIGYRVYLTVAMDGYHAKRTLKVYDANGEEVQRIGMAPDYALKYLYNSDKQTTEFKQLCKAAYQYFIAFAE